jgi:hypothetical protein
MGNRRGNYGVHEMNEVNDGGPAFPVDNNGATYSGMALRDYIAAKALVAFMSSETYVKGLDKSAESKQVLFKDAMAFTCYEMADAMLKAREA